MYDLLKHMVVTSVLSEYSLIAFGPVVIFFLIVFCFVLILQLNHTVSGYEYIVYLLMVQLWSLSFPQDLASHQLFLEDY